MAPQLTWKQILAFGPCRDSLAQVRKAIKAAHPDYQKRSFTLADAAACGVSIDDLLWIAGQASENDPDITRRLRLFATDCAARVAHIANDPRSTAAIIASRAYARGEIDVAAVDAAAWAAGDAAVDAAWAAWAAAWAARAAETNWQRDRLVAWFSDNEPEDWPISAKTERAA